jgi:hypothetical protein
MGTSRSASGTGSARHRPSPVTSPAMVCAIGRSGGDARACRRCLGRRCPTDERNGHGGCDAARLVRVLYRHVGADDGGDDAAGSGSGSFETRSCQRSRARRAAIRRVVSWPSGHSWASPCMSCTGHTERTAAGAIAIAAGVYELTPLKQHFRWRCVESTRSGFEFGLCCVGSSIGLMVVLVALGPMSVTWMCVTRGARHRSEDRAPEKLHRCAASPSGHRIWDPGHRRAVVGSRTRIADVSPDRQTNQRCLHGTEEIDSD